MLICLFPGIFVPRHGQAIWGGKGGGGDIEMLGMRPCVRLCMRPFVTKLVNQISCTDLHNIWPSDAYHHSLGWVLRWMTLTYLDLLFQVAMQKLVCAITSDFMHRFTQYVTQSFIPPKRWVSLKMSDLDLPLTYFSRSQCKISLAQ